MYGLCSRLSALLLSSSSSRSFATQYTITCPPTDPDSLTLTVQKHVATIDKFLASKPIACHTAAAYESVMAQICSKHSVRPLEIILDSGCGTGRSSLLLGREIYPNCKAIIGVDRSLARLNRNQNKSDKTTADNSSNQSIQHVEPNVWLVRAELVDFWRLLLQDPNVTVKHHYVLYPNPYPKRSRLGSRWYGHAVFPLLMQVGRVTTIRSNWDTYLQEMATAARLVHEDGNTTTTTIRGPYERKPEETAWTNFEQKYWNVGERTYELVFHKGEEPQSTS